MTTNVLFPVGNQFGEPEPITVTCSVARTQRDPSTQVTIKVPGTDITMIGGLSDVRTVLNAIANTLAVAEAQDPPPGEYRRAEVNLSFEAAA